MKKIFINANGYKLFLLIFVFLLSCSLEEPFLPSWNQVWVVGLGDIGFTMQEAVKDTNIIQDPTSSHIFLFISGTSDKDSISIKDLYIKPDNHYLRKTIRTIEIKGDTVETYPISVSEIIGRDIGLGSFSIPDTTVYLPDRILSFNNFRYAIIDSGTIQLTYINNTFFDIRPGARISIYDSNDVFIDSTRFQNSIPAYSNGESDLINLSDKMITGKMTLRTILPLKEKTFPIVNPADTAGYAVIQGKISKILVAEAEAKAPVFTVQDSLSLLGEKNKIIRAAIASGNFNIFYENRLTVQQDMQMDIDIKLRNFYTDAFYTSIFTDNSSYTITPEPQSLQHIASMNLGGKYIADEPPPNLQSTTPLDYFKYDFRAELDNSQFIVISKNDSVIAHLVADTLFFNEFTGTLDSVGTRIDPVEEKDFLDFAQVEGNTVFDSLSMTLNVYNEIGIPINASIFVKGKHKDRDTGIISDSVTIDLNNIVVPAGQKEDPSQYTINLSGSDPFPNIIDLMKLMPTEISVIGSAFVSGSGEAKVNDGIWLDYNISSPLYLTINEPLIVKSDIDTTSPGEDLRNMIKNNFRSANMSMDIINHLPLSARLTIHVSTDSTDLFTDDIADSTHKKIITGIDIAAGHVGADGYVDIPVERKMILDLSKEQLEIFSLDTLLFIGSKFTLDETGGMIKFSPTDSIRAENGSIQLELLVND